MKPEQTELFPHVDRKRSRRVWDKQRSADENRRDILTCWKDCQWCDTEPHWQQKANPKFRIYRLCSRPERSLEELTFEHSKICDHARTAAKPQVNKSPVSGWEDY